MPNQLLPNCCWIQADKWSGLLMNPCVPFLIVDGWIVRYLGKRLWFKSSSLSPVQNNKFKPKMNEWALMLPIDVFLQHNPFKFFGCSPKFLFELWCLSRFLLELILALPTVQEFQMIRVVPANDCEFVTATSYNSFVLTQIQQVLWAEHHDHLLPTALLFPILQRGR